MRGDDELQVVLLGVDAAHDLEEAGERELDGALVLLLLRPAKETHQAALLALLLGLLQRLLLRLLLLLGLLDGNLASTPRDIVQVNQRVKNEKQVHRGDHQEVEPARYDTGELLRMHAGRDEEGAGGGYEEDGGGRSHAVLPQLQHGSHDHRHHRQGVPRRQDLREIDLDLLVLIGRVTHEANNHEEHDGNDVVFERSPVSDIEGSHKSSHQHKEDRAGTQDSSSHQHGLVADVGQRDVVVDLDGALVVLQQVHDVGHGGRHPPPALVEELSERLRARRIGVRGSTVLHAVASLQQ